MQFVLFVVLCKHRHAIMRDHHVIALMSWQRLMSSVLLCLSASVAAAAAAARGGNGVTSQDDCDIGVCICEDGVVTCSDHETLTSIPALSAEKTANTTVLVIENQSGLTALTAEDLEGFINLQKLSITACGLSYLEDVVFQHNQQLQYLDLRRNNLAAVPWWVVELKTGIISTILLEDNPLVCNCSMDWMRIRFPNVTGTCVDADTGDRLQLIDVYFDSCERPNVTVKPPWIFLDSDAYYQSSETTLSSVCRAWTNSSSSGDVKVHWDTGSLEATANSRGVEVEEHEIALTCTVSTSTVTECNLTISRRLASVVGSVACVAANDVSGYVGIWEFYSKPQLTIKPLPAGVMGYKPQFDSVASSPSGNRSVTAAAVGQMETAAGQHDWQHGVVFIGLSLCFSGLLLVLLLYTAASYLLHWRRRKRSPQLEDVMKSLCFTGSKRRHVTATPPMFSPNNSVAMTATFGQQLSSDAETQQLVLRTHQSAVMNTGTVRENERYASVSAGTKAGIQHIASSQLRLIRKLGEGEFGAVYLGLCYHLSGPNDVTTVAIKALKHVFRSERSAGNESGEDDGSWSTTIGSNYDELLSDFEREAELLDGLRHKNIISLYGISIDTVPLMILEYMEDGDLNKFLRTRGPDTSLLSQSLPAAEDQLTGDDLLHISCQIADGVEYMSSVHFVHRDLATRNCLVGNRLTVKIGDFGMSRDLYSCDYYKVGSHSLLPIRWMPPESLLYRKFTVESDVWSYGVVLWEIYTFGKQPWYHLSNQQVIDHVQAGDLLSCPVGCPDYIYAIMTQCWRRLPADRPTMSQVRRKLNDFLRLTATSSSSSSSVAGQTGNILTTSESKRDEQYLELLN